MVEQLPLKQLVVGSNPTALIILFFILFKIENIKYPKIVVGALIYNSKKEIFVARSKKWKDKWVIPGGHLEWGEKLEDCVKREVFEETGINVNVVELINVQESILANEYTKQSHMIFLDYLCEYNNGEIVLNDELQEYKWIKPDNALKELELGASTKKLIEKYLARKV